MRFGHPDGAGGLLPIGLLSLQIIYVTIVPTILSAFILIARLIASFTTPHIIANTVLLFTLAPLILVAGILGSLLGILPIFKFHQLMLAQKESMMQALNHVSEKIIDLKRIFINATNEPDEKENSALLKRIDDLETFYQSHQRINLWPLNQRVLLQIWTTQAFLYGQIMALWKIVLQMTKSL